MWLRIICISPYLEYVSRARSRTCIDVLINAYLPTMDEHNLQYLRLSNTNPISGDLLSQPLYLVILPSV